MAGMTHPATTALLIRGVMLDSYHLFSLVVAAAVVWCGVQAWTWTQVMTLPKAAICCVLGWLALLALITQEYNPFIYFIF